MPYHSYGELFQRPQMASLTFSTLHNLFSGTVVRATVSHVKTRLSTMDEPPAKTMNSGTTRESGAGFPSARASDERIVTKTGKDLGGSLVEKPELTRDRNVRKNVGFRERRRMGSSNSSLWFKNENNMVETSSVGRLVVNEKMEKKPKKGDDKEVGKENKGKGFKKSESPEFKVKLELDMCSRRGDVLSAIQLYDKALKEGIKLGQYHYTVLLYLCSSAAVGVIRPAKSGSGGKSLNTLGLSNGVYSLNSMGFNALPEKGDRNLDDAGLNITVLHNEQQVDFVRNRGTTNRNGLNYSSGFDNLSSSSDKKENSSDYSSMSTELDAEILDGNVRRVDNKFSNTKDGNGNQEDPEIQVGKDIKTHALQRGFEIYKKMCMDNVPMNEATLTSVGRMAMSMGDGDLAFDMVKQMKPSGINPRLRSYSPALFSFCNSGDIDKAFAVEKHMLENGICPEEPELEALLRVSVETGKGNKVYYLLHKLRASVRKVSPTTADLIVKWFSSKAASRVGKTKWDKSLIKEAIENGGGGWHGQGWLGKGRWSISYTTVGADGMCKCCGGRLAIIDLDPNETEDFAESVASIATKKEKNSSFQKFQKWLDYYGPFEAVVDAANIGLFSQKRFLPSRVSAVVNGIRQKLPSKKWPLIVLHNKRITGSQMDKPEKRALIEKWKYADALYATPTGSNDDWYWLYAAIKFKCLLVTNDEMRDHIFQLLGNDFFPKWKERHQVRFRFSDGGPIFYMPPPCSVVIQESDEGHWHIPVASENEYEAERIWICVTRARSHVPKQDSATSSEESPSLQSNEGNASSACQTEVTIKPEPNHANQEDSKIASQEIYKSLRDILSVSLHGDDKHSILSQIEAAEIFGNCIIDFQI